MTMSPASLQTVQRRGSRPRAKRTSSHNTREASADMDPNATLDSLRDLARKAFLVAPCDLPVVADELAAGFEALDDWIKRGGFLPDDWKRP